MPRPPKPISIHKLQGTYQPSRHAHRAYEPEASGLPVDAQPPSWLTPAQKKLWKDVLRRAPWGVLREIDAELLAGYVVHADALAAAVRAQAKLPLVDADGRPSPYLRLARQSTETMVRLGAEMGFTPAGRARLGVPVATPAAAEPDNPYMRFDVVSPDGTRTPYTPPGRQRSTKLPS